MSEIKLPQAKEFFESIKLRENVTDIKLEFLSRIVTIIFAGLALVTALAWDDVLHDVYNSLFSSLTGIPAKLGYAIFITVLAVIISVIITKLFFKKTRKTIKERE